MFGVHIGLQLEHIGAERHVHRVDEKLGTIIAVGRPHTWTWRQIYKRIEKAFNAEIRERGCEKDRGDRSLQKLVPREGISGDLQKLQIVLHLCHRLLRDSTV